MRALTYELLPEVTSTMDLAKQRKAGCGDFLIQALSQTKGKGQQDRKFSSKPGGFYGTFVIRKGMRSLLLKPIQVAHCLITQSKEYLGVDLLIKWPNDIYAINKKKVGGILIEQDEESWRIGIGINIFGNAISPICGEATAINELDSRLESLDGARKLAPLKLGKGQIKEDGNILTVSHHEGPESQTESFASHRSAKKANSSLVAESINNTDLLCPYPLSSFLFQTTARAVIASMFDLVNKRRDFTHLTDHLIWPKLITFQPPGSQIKTGRMIGLDPDYNLLVATNENDRSILHTIISSGTIIENTW